MAIKTQAQIIAEINAEIIENTQELISATEVHDILIDIVDSGFNSISGTTGFLYAGTIPGASFFGSPLIANVVFSVPFTANTYSVTVGSEENKVFTIENKSVNGFDLNSNSDYAFTGNTYWIACTSGNTNLSLFSSASSGGTGGSGGTSANLWSASTGTNSIIANNGSGNLASGNYSLAGGKSNSALTNYSVVVGGYRNFASAQLSFVGGGSHHTASGYYSFIGGGGGDGIGHTASGGYSVVTGGYRNTASGYASAVSGGKKNITSGTLSFVGGGIFNTAYGFSSSVGGGYNNIASGYVSVVGGGWNNTAYKLSAVVGGTNNVTSAYFSIVGGGLQNTASGLYSIVGGGKLNTASGLRSSILGGNQNATSGLNSSILGGNQNTTSGLNSSIINGSGNTLTSTAINSVILGQIDFTGDQPNTVYLKYANGNSISATTIYSGSTDLSLLFGSIGGSGTTDFVAKFTPDGTHIGDSLLFDNGNSMGLGTTTPSSRLVVQGRLPVIGTGTVSTNGVDDEVLGVGTLYLTELNLGDIITIGAETRVIRFILDNTHLNIDGDAFSVNAAQPFSFTQKIFQVLDSAGNNKLIIEANGNIGIGQDYARVNNTPDDILSMIRNEDNLLFASTTNRYSGNSAGAGFDVSSDVAEGVLLALSSTNNILDPSFAGDVIVGSLNSSLRVLANNDIVFISFNYGEIAKMTDTGLMGIGATTPTASLHVKGANGYNQLRMETPFTPANSADANGNIGDMAWDDSYVYVKVSTGWKRSTLSAF